MNLAIFRRYPALAVDAPAFPVENLTALLNTPQGPQKFATILSQEAKQLPAMDRYERRALSRRKSPFEPSMKHVDMRPIVSTNFLVVLLAERSQKCSIFSMRRDRQLRNGSIPIFEPGLEALVGSNVKAGRFSRLNSRAAIRTAHTVFLAVGTPSRRGDGFAPSEARNTTTRARPAARCRPRRRRCRVGPGSIRAESLLHWQIRFSCTLRTLLPVVTSAVLFD